MFNKLLKSARKTLKPLSENKFLLGIVLLLINIGSKYIELNLTKNQEDLIRNYIGREILIFSMVFLGTRDVVTAILMTAAFVVLSSHLFHEESNFCILPSKIKQISKEIDSNKDGHISDDELNQAIKALHKMKESKKRENNNNFMTEQSILNR